MKAVAPPVLAAALALLVAAATAHAGERMRVVLLPIDFTVLEMSASGITETVPDWTSAAQASLDEAARGLLSKNANFELIPFPQLTPDEQATLKEHVALYKLTAFTAEQLLTFGGTWNERRTHFDYTLGDGLGFLAQKSGADAALCIAGAQAKSSGGRVAMFFLLAVAGVAIPLGGAEITAGLVDLKTGNVTWMEASRGVDDVRAADGAAKTLDALIGKYPKSRLLGRK